MLRFDWLRSGVLFGILVLCAPGASAIVVQFQNADGGLSSARISERGAFVGFIGDFVDLDPGEHALSIAGPHDYFLNVTIDLSGNSGTILKTHAEPSPCGSRYAVTWPAPTFARTDKKDKRDDSSDTAVGEASPARLLLRVATPVFGAPADRGSCALPSMVGCDRSFAIVNVDSTPKGAEIWIDGKMVDARTEQKLSVSFCKNEKSKRILLRMKERVSCIRNIPVSEGSTTRMSCSLARPD